VHIASRDSHDLGPAKLIGTFSLPYRIQPERIFRPEPAREAFVDNYNRSSNWTIFSGGKLSSPPHRDPQGAKIIRRDALQLSAWFLSRQLAVSFHLYPASSAGIPRVMFSWASVFR
jgi:hypothetical protein